MSCLMDCVEVGPPPDTILFMPPPPAPSFILQRLRDNATSLLGGAVPCGSPLCAVVASAGSVALGGGVVGAAGSGIGAGLGDWEPARGDYVELPRQDVGTADDTWPLVLVAASVGVLVLGALLALFLLRQHAKEQHRVGKTSVQVGETSSDARAVCWAALTPRGGTQHFVSVDDDEHHHYETVDGPWYRAAYESCDPQSPPAPEYEEPTTPAWLLQQPTQQQQQDMRCISTLRRPRPRVSPPTRIEHPNLPPLNLNPLPVPPRRASNVGTLSRRPSDTGTILKYNIN